VGLATAEALLTGAPAGRGCRVVVLEAEARVGAHQTGHNSGVIHSGLYYRPGSLKAQTCASGRDALYAFCEEHDIPHRRTGKLVVATREDQLGALEMLESRGRANGLTGIKRLDADEIRRLDPEVSAIAGLWVAETGVVNFGAVAGALADQVKRRGGEVRLAAPVHTISQTSGSVRLGTPQGDVTARLIVNCAGLHSDRVARLAGVDPGVAIVPFRGEYYELRPDRAGLVRNLVYPVPDPDLPFLGVHFTRRIDGRVEAGPNAVLAWQRDGYSRWSFRMRDAIDTLRFPGFWRLARRFWRTGVAEQGRSWSKTLFVRALQQLVPAIRSDDLRWGGCGVRAQAVDHQGRLVDDFHIVEGESGIHVVNAPSPAATASLSIGRQVAERAVRRLLA
jgi:(S)-2-hydroxyglutarate dehydrogenase